MFIQRCMVAPLYASGQMTQNDDRLCNDDTRPVVFKIERIDIPENEEEKLCLEKQNFKNMADDAYTG